MRYQVKWIDEAGKCQYGLYRGVTWDHMAIGHKKAPPGFVWVEYALDGCYSTVRENLLVDIPSNPGTYNRVIRRFEGCDEYMQYMQDQYREAKAKSDAIEGFKAGKLFAVDVADGKAYYVVTRVNKKTCQVQWRGFHPDRWMAPVLGCGDTFRIYQIRPLC